DALPIWVAAAAQASRVDRAIHAVERGIAGVGERDVAREAIHADLAAVGTHATSGRETAVAPAGVAGRHAREDRGGRVVAALRLDRDRAGRGRDVGDLRLGRGRAADGRAAVDDVDPLVDFEVAGVGLERELDDQRAQGRRGVDRAHDTRAVAVHVDREVAVDRVEDRVDFRGARLEERGVITL